MWCREHVIPPFLPLQCLIRISQSHIRSFFQAWATSNNSEFQFLLSTHAMNQRNMWERKAHTSCLKCNKGWKQSETIVNFLIENYLNFYDFVPSCIGWPTLTIHFSLTFTPFCTSFFPLHSTLEYNRQWNVISWANSTKTYNHEGCLILKS